MKEKCPEDPEKVTFTGGAAEFGSRLAKLSEQTAKFGCQRWGVDCPSLCSSALFHFSILYYSHHFHTKLFTVSDPIKSSKGRVECCKLPGAKWILVHCRHCRRR